ncbi:carbohydrate kinase family protein [Paenarthrobacter sp. Z7-10]|uniref:carbohydrate kinase family protein n=1 Tax=Paenarthrobacter sp. Z7-10 TaxID=2787635 RepID=UPI0022A904CE|nr:carbohydrate kinase family protein [Paenarthrobacter sp. Z7-10]
MTTTAPHLDLLFAGSIFCDLVFADVPLPAAGAEVFANAFALTPGGVANRAVAAARLGARTGLLSQLGDDALGTSIDAMLCAEPDLDLAWLQRIPGFQSPVSVALTGAHERSFITYQEDADPLQWQNGGPTVGATHVGVQQPLPDWVARLRAAGTKVFGGVGWDASGVWSETVLHRLAEVDVFVPNDTEAMRYTRTSTAADAARALGNYVELAVVTEGSRGAVAFQRSTGELIQVRTVPVDAIDPTGAGDVFVAALMVSERFGWPLGQRLQLAVLSASLSVRTLGGAASAPRPCDIAEFLSAESPAGNWSIIKAWAAAQAISEEKE